MMPDAMKQFPQNVTPLIVDPTGTVNLADPAQIESSIETILRGIYRNQCDTGLIALAVNDLVRAYRGQYPGLLRSDTLYHDLRHALETGLTAARLLDAYMKSADSREMLKIDAHHAALCILLGLFHDVGLLRRESEADLWGPVLIPVHEERGVEFVRNYLLPLVPPASADLARLIMVTKFVFRIPEEWTPSERLLAAIIETADLLSQFSDRSYLEKCRDYLFVEFSACGMAGTSESPYPDSEALLAGTPSFFENVVFRRLENEGQGIYKLLPLHTGNGNPWLEAIQHDLNYLEKLMATRSMNRLRRKPLIFN